MSLAQLIVTIRGILNFPVKTEIVRLEEAEREKVLLSLRKVAKIV